MLLPPVGDRPLPQAMLVVHQGLTWKITYLRFKEGAEIQWSKRCFFINLIVYPISIGYRDAFWHILCGLFYLST